MTERRQLYLALGCLVLAAVVSSAGGGGGTTGEVPPPPLLPDFVLNLSTSTATISQNTTSSGIQISVQPLNGFSGSVQVTVSGLPSGVISNPQSPSPVDSDGCVTLLLAASTSAAAGGASISMQGTSGSISHAKTISLTVQSGVAAVVSRTSYSRTDASGFQTGASVTIGGKTATTTFVDINTLKSLPRCFLLARRASQSATPTVNRFAGMPPLPLTESLPAHFIRTRARSNFSLAQFIQIKVETKSKKIPLFEAQ